MLNLFKKIRLAIFFLALNLVSIGAKSEILNITFSSRTNEDENAAKIETYTKNQYYKFNQRNNIESMLLDKRFLFNFGGSIGSLFRKNANINGFQYTDNEYQSISAKFADNNYKSVNAGFGGRAGFRANMDQRYFLFADTEFSYSSNISKFSDNTINNITEDSESNAIPFFNISRFGFGKEIKDFGQNMNSLVSLISGISTTLNRTAISESTDSFIFNLHEKNYVASLFLGLRIDSARNKNNRYLIEITAHPGIEIVSFGFATTFGINYEEHFMIGENSAIYLFVSNYFKSSFHLNRLASDSEIDEKLIIFNETFAGIGFNFAI